MEVEAEKKEDDLREYSQFPFYGAIIHFIERFSMMTNGEYFIIKGLLTFHDYAIKYQDKLEIDFFYDQNVKVLLKAIKSITSRYSRIQA